MSNVDIIICIVPKIHPEAPTVGPAILKAHLEAEGFTCKVYDLNVKLYNFLNKKALGNKYFFEDDSVFASFENKVSDEFNNFYEQNKDVFDEFMTFLKEHNPKWVGFSLLSDYSKSAALKLSELVRSELPLSKIVWGGTQLAKRTRLIKQAGFCDHYIVGDAEQAIIELLKENFDSKGIDENGSVQLHNLNLIKLPNYDDIDWNEYPRFLDNNPVYITGSRGCIKDCVFCSVSTLWPKFVLRAEDSITAEVKYLIERYNRTTFKFTDSLVNGSIKTYNNMVENFIEIKKQKPDFAWTGQWIIRNRKQIKEEDFEKLSQSGIVRLEIGVETFNEHVRYNMGKKFTDDDLWWSLEMLRKYNIPQSLLFITGYPIETEEDHKNTLSSIRRLGELGYIWGDNGDQILTLNFTPMLLDKSTAEKFSDHLEYYRDFRDWKYKDNDKETRIRRFSEIINEIQIATSKDLDWRTFKDLGRYTK